MITEDNIEAFELDKHPKDWNIIEVTKCILHKPIKVGKVQTREYKKKGRYAIIDQSQLSVAGYSDDNTLVYKGDLPVIIFGDHTRVFKYIDFPFICGADGVKVLLPNIELLNSKFFFYSLLGLKIENKGYNRHYSLLREKNIAIPPLDEQRKIAYVLSTIQDAKEKTEKVITALKEVKKSLMKHLFTYGPVPISEIDNVELKETEIGNMDLNWDLIALKKLGLFQYGYTAKAESKEIGPRYIRITDIDMESNDVSWENVPFCKLPANTLTKYKLEDNDILIARIGATTGKTCLIHNNPLSVFASYLIRFKTDREMCNASYAFYFTQHALYWKQIDSRKEGKLKKGISASELKEILIPLPTIQDQDDISLIISCIDRKINQEKTRLRSIQLLFKSMLATLMTAKVRITGDINEVD